MKKARQGEPFEVHFCCTLQPQRLFQRGNAAARNRNFLVGGIQRQKQRAAGNGLDFFDMRKVHQVAAMHAEEAVAIEALSS